MANNTNIVNDTQPNTQPAVNGNQSGGRLFTQEEVNKILRNRLEREKRSDRLEHEDDEAPQAEPAAQEVSDREKELAARESLLECRVYLLDNGYPSVLLDVIDTSSPKEFSKRADIVYGLLRQNRRSEPVRSSEPTGVDGGAFSSSKHIPRKYPLDS